MTNYHHEDLYNYQTRLSIDFAECMDSSFVDLRFVDTDDGHVYDHWIEYVNPGENAVIWVAIDTLVKYTPKEMYMYYSNGAATDVSDPEKVFVFYDDFNQDQGWNIIGDTSTTITSMSNGTTILKKESECEASGVWKSLGETITNFKLIARDYRPTTADSSCYIHEYGVEDATQAGFSFRRDGHNSNTDGEIGLIKRQGETISNETMENADQPSGDWYYTEVSYCHICLFNLNSVLRDTSMSTLANVYSSDYNLYDFDRFSLRGGHTYYLDYVAVAQKACIEPQYVIFDTVESCPIMELLSYTADHCEEGEGEIMFTTSGGVAPYVATWYLGQDSISTATLQEGDTLTISDLPKGIYTIKIGDEQGCSD